MAQSYLMIDVNDERTNALAEVLSNKTCKKIIQLLSEKELSETEIANKLESPANTINYNVKKLVDVGLIERAEKFWSVKGKSVSTYRISNKKILISPRPMIKGILPVAIVTGIIAVGVKMFFGINKIASSSVSQKVMPAIENSGEVFAKTMASDSLAAPMAERVADVALSQTNVIIPASSSAGPWAWFLLGAWMSILLFVVWQVWKR